MELYIVRHGQSMAQTGEDKGCNPYLSAVGEVQADLLGKRMADIEFDYIFSSHLTRAFQTAVGVARYQKNNVPITVVPEFAECGIITDWHCDIEKMEKIYPHIICEKDFLGNGYKTDKERAEAGLCMNIYNIAYEQGFTSEKESNEGIIRSNDKNVLIAAHGMFNAYLLGLLVDFPFDKNHVIVQKNTCINHFSLYTVAGVRRVRFNAYNDYSHLPAELLNSIIFQ